jgi:hypothetical protein
MRGRAVRGYQPSPTHRPISFPFLALAGLSSGIALMLAILFDVSLPLTLALLIALALAVGWARWAASGPLVRLFLRRQLLAGLVAGVVATAAYDLTRLLLYAAGGLVFFPLEALRIFGELLLGADASAFATWVAGGLYHEFNGITFAIAYALLAGGRPWMTGVAWALGLELAMVSLYPSWLDLDAVLPEFLGLSLTGHLAYGAAVGAICGAIEERVGQGCGHLSYGSGKMMGPQHSITRAAAALAV